MGTFTQAMWGDAMVTIGSPYYHSAPYTDAFCIRIGSHIFNSGGETVGINNSGVFFTAYTGCANLSWSVLIGSP